MPSGSLLVFGSVLGLGELAQPGMATRDNGMAGVEYTASWGSPPWLAGSVQMRCGCDSSMRLLSISLLRAIAVKQANEHYPQSGSIVLTIQSKMWLCQYGGDFTTNGLAHSNTGINSKICWLGTKRSQDSATEPTVYSHFTMESHQEPCRTKYRNSNYENAYFDPDRILLPDPNAPNRSFSVARNSILAWTGSQQHPPEPSYRNHLYL